MARTAVSAPLPCAATGSRARSAHGDAPDPLFSGGRRHVELHPRGRAVPRLATRVDPGDPAARGGAGLATELVRLNVDVLVTSGPSATRAAKRATATIP